MQKVLGLWGFRKFYRFSSAWSRRGTKAGLMLNSWRNCHE